MQGTEYWRTTEPDQDLVNQATSRITCSGREISLQPDVSVWPVRSRLTLPLLPLSLTICEDVMGDVGGLGRRDLQCTQTHLLVLNLINFRFVWCKH
jgi:hypothetical protein